MPEETSIKQKNSFSLDWLMRGVLTKFGEAFDRFTGRNWQPSSSLATSELIERLKKLLDREVRDMGARGRFVPHNIKLKMQWDKFSADTEVLLETLKRELLIAAVDHINDNRYHTFAPLKLEIKQDYFTEGVKLQANFDRFAESAEDAELNVTFPHLNKNEIFQAVKDAEIKCSYLARFYLGNELCTVSLQIGASQHLSVGRTKENDLAIDDISISKVHASLSLTNENQLLISDTGSTNGTFINEQRIPYGKAFSISKNDKIAFGSVNVTFELIPVKSENKTVNGANENNSTTIGEFEFKSKTDLRNSLEE